MPAALRWVGLALLGIVIAAAVSVAASRLASQQIGLASEPISAGDALAPARQEHRHTPAQSHGSKGHGKHRTPPRTAPPQPTTPTTPAPSPPIEEVEPSHTGGDGEHGGGGADD